MRKPVTLEDVARLAGVSAKTVSRVINDEPHVRPAKREAVEKAIATLGYRPNIAARSLASARSFLVCAISPWLESSYFQELHSQLIRACKACGYHLVIEEINLHHKGALLELENSLANMRCEHAILSPSICDNANILALLDRLGVNHVRISPATQPERSAAVSVDQAQGMRLVAEYLWSLGHRRYAVVADPHPEAPMRRSELLIQYLQELGCPLEAIDSVHLNFRLGGPQAGRECARAILASPVKPTAIFSYADEVATGIIAHALENGLRIPHDLSIVGFDDFYVAQLVWPPLTTVRVSLERVAQAAVSLLLDARYEAQNHHILCPVELIVRESTSMPPADAH